MKKRCSIFSMDNGNSPKNIAMKDKNIVIYLSNRNFGNSQKTTHNVSKITKGGDGQIKGENIEILQFENLKQTGDDLEHLGV